MFECCSCTSGPQRVIKEMETADSELRVLLAGLWWVTLKTRGSRENAEGTLMAHTVTRHDRGGHCGPAQDFIMSHWQLEQNQPPPDL